MKARFEGGLGRDRLQHLAMRVYNGGHGGRLNKARLQYLMTKAKTGNELCRAELDQPPARARSVAESRPG